MLDEDPTVEGLRAVVSSWLERTVTLNPPAWIDLCQRIMARTTASHQVAMDTTVGLWDEASEGLGAWMGFKSRYIRADSEVQQGGISGMGASYTDLARETPLPVSLYIVVTNPSL